MFHWTDGWFFERQDDGAVHVIKIQPGQALSQAAVDVSIPPDSWASIVASVSAGGEITGRFSVARQFHNSTGAQTLTDFNEEGKRPITKRGTKDDSSL